MATLAVSFAQSILTARHLTWHYCSYVFWESVTRKIGDPLSIIFLHCIIFFQLDVSIAGLLPPIYQFSHQGPMLETSPTGMSSVFQGWNEKPMDSSATALRSIQVAKHTNFWLIRSLMKLWSLFHAYSLTDTIHLMSLWCLFDWKLSRQIRPWAKSRLLVKEDVFILVKCHFMCSTQAS